MNLLTLYTKYWLFIFKYSMLQQTYLLFFKNQKGLKHQIVILSSSNTMETSAEAFYLVQIVF